MAQSQNTKVEYTEKAISMMGLATYGDVMIGDAAFEFYNEKNPEDFIQIPWDEVDYVAAEVLFGKKIARFAIFTKTSGAFCSLMRPTIPTTNAFSGILKSSLLIALCTPFSYVSMSTPLKMTCNLLSLQILFSNADCFSASEMQIILSQNIAAIFSIAVYIAFFFAVHRILNAHPCGLYTQ